MYLDSIPLLNVIETYTKTNSVGGLSIVPVLILLVDLALKITIVYAVIKFIIVMNIYIKKNK
jgi:hypothetical protein